MLKSRVPLSGAHASLVLALALGVLLALPYSAATARSEADFKATLSSAERQSFERYMSARTAHRFKLDKYWKRVLGQTQSASR